MSCTSRIPIHLIVTVVSHALQDFLSVDCFVSILRTFIIFSHLFCNLGLSPIGLLCMYVCRVLLRFSFTGLLPQHLAQFRILFQWIIAVGYHALLGFSFNGLLRQYIARFSILFQWIITIAYPALLGLSFNGLLRYYLRSYDWNVTLPVNCRILNIDHRIRCH